jgi:hypothetical protein
MLVTMAIIFAYTYVWQFTLWAASLVCFVWGFQEAYVSLFLNCVLGFEFESKIVPFAAKSGIQSFVVFALLFMEAQITSQTKFMWYFGGVSCLGLFAWAILFKF